MTKKIFRSTLLVAVCALLASLVLIMGCLYDYFAGLQSQALRDELTLAASGVSQGGENYLDTIDSNRYLAGPKWHSMRLMAGVRALRVELRSMDGEPIVTPTRSQIRNSPGEHTSNVGTTSIMGPVRKGFAFIA